jgi:hypothetical protein
MTHSNKPEYVTGRENRGFSCSQYVVFSTLGKSNKMKLGFSLIPQKVEDFKEGIAPLDLTLTRRK